MLKCLLPWTDSALKKVGALERGLALNEGDLAFKEVGALGENRLQWLHSTSMKVLFTQCIHCRPTKDTNSNLYRVHENM